MTVAPNGAGNGVVVTGPDFTMDLQGEDGQGNPLPLSDGVLVLEQDRTLRTTGSGFFPDTDVSLYLDPPVIGNGSMLRINPGGTLLGSVRTSALGSFDGTVTLDASVGVGDHVVQAIGVTQSNAERSMSLGVRVEAEPLRRPGPVRDLAVITSTATTVTVSWRPPADDGGAPVQRYRVRHRLKGQDLYQGRLHVAGLKATIRGLTPGKVYYIRVRAINAVGAGPTDEFVRVRLPRS